MNVNLNELRSSASGLIERAKSARTEADYFDGLGMKDTAARLRSEADDFDSKAANIVYELAGFGAD